MFQTLIATLIVMLSLGKEAVAITSTTSDYYADVPTELRSLVSQDTYDTRLKQLTKAGGHLLSNEAIRETAASPCGECLVKFMESYASDPAIAAALDAVVSGLQQPPAYADSANPWSGSSNADELVVKFLETFVDWCTWLPEISGDQDDGLQYIEQFLWLWYRNPAGVAFVQGWDPMNEKKPMAAGFTLFNEFSAQRGHFLDSKASTAFVNRWLNDPRIEIEDYKKQKVDEYVSWNDFFSREIIVDKSTMTIPSRPVTMPNRDYIISAPTDCIVNPLVQVLVENDEPHREFISSPLSFDMMLDIKNIPISLSDLLHGVPKKYRDTFVGGSGLSCILMPNTYHHYHTPVSGTVVHASVMDQFGTFGYNDIPNWLPPDGNVGRIGTDFSQFSNYQRGVVIIEVKYANVPGKVPKMLTGYVATIPVGLDTVGSVVLDKDIKPGKVVKRGYTRIGSFYYGGSLNILLFSKGMMSPAVQSRLGNQIGIINIGASP